MKLEPTSVASSAPAASPPDPAPATAQPAAPTATTAAKLGAHQHRFDQTRFNVAVARAANLSHALPALDLFSPAMADRPATVASNIRASALLKHLSAVALHLQDTATVPDLNRKPPPPPDPNRPQLAGPVAIIENPRAESSRISIALAGQALQMVLASQQKNLSQLTFAIAPEQHGAAMAAVARYVTGNAALVMDALGTAPEERDTATGALQELLLAGKDGLSDEALQAAVARLSGPARQIDKQRIKSAVLAPQSQLQPYGALLQTLEQELTPLLQAPTAESRAAFAAMRTDAAAMTSVGYPLLVAVTALNSRTANNAAGMMERAKDALLHSNMAALKVIQTVLNMRVDDNSSPQMKEIRDFVQNGLKAKDGPMGMIISSVERDAEFQRKFPGKRFEDVFHVDPAWIAEHAGATTALGIPARVTLPAEDGLPERVVDGWLKVVGSRDPSKSLEAQIEEAERVVQIISDMLRGAAGTTGLEQQVAVLDLVDTVAHAVIQSLKRELQQNLERDAMVSIRHKLRDVEVYVPRPFEAVSGGCFTFMERVHGWELTDVVSHFREAQHARRRGDYRGEGDKGPEANAERRFHLWARRTYGMAPTAIELQKKPYGYDARLTFADSVYPEATASLLDDGSIGSRSRCPDLSVTAFKKLRSLLTVGTFAQLIRGHAHADMHDKNFKVLPDKMIPALIDFGSTLKPSLRQFMAPARLLLGSVLGRTRMMAQAFVDMSHHTILPTGEQRRELATQLNATLVATQKGRPVKGSLATKMKRGWADCAAAGKGLGLEMSSEYVQMLRLSTAMYGNLKQFRTGLDEDSFNVLQVARDLFRATLRHYRNSGTADDLDRAKDQRVVQMGGVAPARPVYAETVASPTAQDVREALKDEPAAA